MFPAVAAMNDAFLPDALHDNLNHSITARIGLDPDMHNAGMKVKATLLPETKEPHKTPGPC